MNETEDKQNKTEINKDKTENKQISNNSNDSSISNANSNSNSNNDIDNKNETDKTEITHRKNKVSERQLEALRKLRERRAILKTIKTDKIEKNKEKTEIKQNFNIVKFLMDNSLMITGLIIIIIVSYFFFRRQKGKETGQDNTETNQKIAKNVGVYNPVNGGGYLRS